MTRAPHTLIRTPHARWAFFSSGPGSLVRVSRKSRSNRASTRFTACRKAISSVSFMGGSTNG